MRNSFIADPDRSPRFNRSPTSPTQGPTLVYICTFVDPFLSCTLTLLVGWVGSMHFYFLAMTIRI